MATVKIGNAIYDPEKIPPSMTKIRVGNVIYDHPSESAPPADPEGPTPPLPVLVIDDGGGTIPEPISRIQEANEHARLVADQDPSTNEVETSADDSTSDRPTPVGGRRRKG